MSGAVWVALAVALVLTVQIARPLYRHARRRRQMREPLSMRQREVVRHYVPLTEKLPREYRARHEGLVRVFLAEKTFVGCAGLELTDDMRWSIAAQACLLLINRDDGVFDQMRTVLVYPEAFYVEHEEVDAAGIAHRGRRLLSGESWSQGQVVVSWADAKRGGALAADGYNVVIHEFAHQLDGADGDVNGAPLLGNEMPAREWSQKMSAGFEALREAIASRTPTLIDHYGATNPAEFLAVTSEHFFEQPEALMREHRDIYGCLKAVYQIDPATWR